MTAAIISALASAGAAIANSVMQNQTNERNQANLEKAWLRDDTAISRARTDAERAGFSPLAALSNTLGNTNPGTLTAPQFDVSGFNTALSEGANRSIQRKAQEMQQKVNDATVRGLDLDNESKELENGVKKQRLEQELLNSELDIASKIGILLDAGVIEASDIPEYYQKFSVNQTLAKERKIEADKVAAQVDANAVAREKIAADEKERQWQHDAVNETKTVRNKVSFDVYGQKYELEVTDTKSGKAVAVASGVNPAESPVSSVAAKNFSSNPVVDDHGDRNTFYVGVTDNGLPCYSDGRPLPTYYVAIPNSQGISYYKISKGSINMKNSGDKAEFPASSYSELAQEFWK